MRHCIHLWWATSKAMRHCVHPWWATFSDEFFIVSSFRDVKDKADFVFLCFPAFPAQPCAGPSGKFGFLGTVSNHLCWLSAPAGNLLISAQQFGTRRSLLIAYLHSSPNPHLVTTDLHPPLFDFFTTDVPAYINRKIITCHTLQQEATSDCARRYRG